MLQRNIESAKIILDCIQTLFDGTKKPFNVEEFTFYNEHYDKDMTGIKITDVDHDDVFCVLAEVKINDEIKTLAGTRTKSTTYQVVWKPYVYKGDSSVGEIDGIECDYTFAPHEGDMFIDTIEALHQGVLSLLQFYTRAALDSKC